MSNKVTVQEIVNDKTLSAQDKIDALTKLAHAAIGEAETLADEYEIEFSFSVAYGMGGTYGRSWDASSDSEFEWQSSSQSC